MRKKKIKYKVGHLYRTYYEFADDIVMVTKVNKQHIYYYYLDDPDNILCEELKDAQDNWYGELDERPNR